MSNLFSDNLILSHDSEMLAHMPQSFQIMIQIQQEAEAEFKAIVSDIEAGKTTLAEVKRTRGLSG